MQNYLYTAKSFDGQTERGNATAESERHLAQLLRARGLLLIYAENPEKKSWKDIKINISFGGISTTDIIMLVRNLGVMFSTGLSLVKSFDILAGQAKNKKMKDALLDIKDRINKGETFSDALARYPKIFNDLFCNMIKVGEESGTLDEIFQVLALQLTKEHELKSKIKNAMIYPAIILMVMLVIGGIIITVVLPSLNVFFTSLNVDIPFYTRALLFLGKLISAKWYWFLLGLVVAGIATFFSLRTKKGKFLLDTMLIRTPIISSIIKKNNSAFLVRSLSSLISAGVSLVRALEITSQTMGNHYFKAAVADAMERIKKGEKLSNALKPHQDIFPFGVTEMVEVGEETGETSAILKKLADFYEQEAMDAIEKLTVIIEPMMIIVLGLAVGFFAFSIIQPMYSSLQNIK